VFSLTWRWISEIISRIAATGGTFVADGRDVPMFTRGAIGAFSTVELPQTGHATSPDADCSS
jgi:hypothetical protein